MNVPPSTERFRILPLPLQISALVLCWTLTIVAMRIPDWMAIVAGLITGCLAIAFLFFQEIHIDFQQGVITDVRRLLGILPVWQRRRTKEEFAGIKCYCASGVTNDISDRWVVALHPRSGRAIDVRQFSVVTGSATCPEAQAFARELSRLTALEVIDDDAQPD